MSLWRSYKPTIARVHGHAVAGGSDIALCCDMIIMAEEAKIGYPPARVWGCPTTAMWVYRLGVEKAKRMLLTGDLITGKEAADLGLVYEAVPRAALDERIAHWTQRMQGVPRNQLMMQKLMINQAIENMGLNQTQMFATLFDGATRHSPEGMWFKQRAEEVGRQPRVARQPRSVVNAQAVGGELFRGQPITDRGISLDRGPGWPLRLGPDGQEQIAGHNIIAVLVHVADENAQRR